MTSSSSLCICMMDEVDALQRWRRWGLWSDWIEKFKKVGKIEFARIIFEEFAISFSLWQLIDMQTKWDWDWYAN
jgi:hypothetical protein